MILTAVEEIGQLRGWRRRGEGGGLSSDKAAAASGAGVGLQWSRAWSAREFWP